MQELQSKVNSGGGASAVWLRVNAVRCPWMWLYYAELDGTVLDVDSDRCLAGG
jgi:hypothetical protein